MELANVLVIVRIGFYAYGGFEAVHRRNYLVWTGLMFFIIANTIFAFGVARDWLDVFRTAGAIALVVGYIRKR